MHLGRLLCEEVGVLQAVVYAVLVDIREAHALLASRLDQLLAELHALLGRELREDVLGRLLVHIGGKLRGNLLVASRRLLIRNRLRSLLEAVDKVLVVLLRTTERVVCPIYTLIS